MTRSKGSPQLPDDGFWSRLSPLQRHGLILGVLLAVSLAFFAPIHFGGQALQGSDTLNWRGMAEAMIEHEEETGEQALWAPNLFGGMPGFLVNYDPAVPQLDSIVDWVRGFAWPTSHHFVLLAGVYFLVFYLTKNSLAGLVAALAFGLTTYIPIILGVGHNTKFVAMAYAPYVILAFAHTLRRPTLLAGLLFAGALALELRARHPQITYYVMMLIGTWWAVEVVGALRNDRERQIKLAKSTGWLALGTGLALLMIAQPYLAINEYRDFTTRGAAPGGQAGEGALDWEYAMQWSQGPSEMITLLIADAFGGGGETYWGPKPFTEGPHYTGAAAIALALIAVWKVRRNAVYGLGIGVVLTSLFAMGRHAEWMNRPMFEYFPFFDSFRTPETWLSITTLAIAVLAGLGMNYIMQRDPSRKSKRRGRDIKSDFNNPRTKSVYVVFGGLFVAILAFIVLDDTLLSFEQPQEEQQIMQAIQQQQPGISPDDPEVQQFIQQEMAERREERQSAFRNDALRALLFLGLAGLAFGLYRRERIAPWVAAGLVAIVVIVDLWGVGERYLDEERLAPDRSAAELIEQRHTYGFDRFIKERVEEASGPGHFRVLPLALNPMNNAMPSYHYEQIGGYHGAKLQIYQDYIDHMLQLGDGRPNQNALNLMSTRYVIAQQELPGMETVYRDDQTGILVLENPEALPRAFLVGETEVIDNAEQTWERLRDPNLNLQETAILPEPLERDIEPVGDGSTAEVELESFTPNEIEWTVATDAPRLFVASEVYYPAGWDAYINGEEVPIHRVNYLLRGLHVPEGEHTVTMRFEPAADQIGRWVSGVTTALTYGGIFLLLGLKIRRRRDDNLTEGAGEEE